MKVVKEFNIFFIVTDALRSENLGCYGYSGTTSPNIDNLAKEGALFQKAYASINTTDPSLTTIFSGRYPRSHGIINHGEKVNENEVKKLKGVPLLPEILKNEKYTTLAVDWLGRWHNRGYDFYGCYISRVRKLLKRVKDKVTQNLKPVPDARELTNTALKLLKMNHRKKFFLFIRYFDTHTPYLPPKKFAVKFYKKKLAKTDKILNKIDNGEWKEYLSSWLDPDLDYVLAQYDGAIRYIDDQIGRIIYELDKYKILDDTLIILTSDHGESLLEHGIYFDHHGLYETSIHVPFIFRYPNYISRCKIESFVQHIDIVPTILDALNIDISNFNFDGKNLLPLLQEGKKELRSRIFAEEWWTENKVAIRTEEYKYIQAQSEKGAACRYCGCVHGGVKELYNLKNDPEETNNILEEKPRIAEELKNELLKHFKAFDQSIHLEESKLETDSEYTKIKNRLRSLGYI